MRIVIFILFSLFVVEMQAQYDHKSVFSGESGDDLIAHLKEAYKPEVVLDYSEAKDVMYGEIYLENDSVKGVYSGHTLYLQPGTDPSVWLYKNGSQDGINAEHTYPRSKGAAVGNATGDLYHLFPTRIQVNSDRGSLPFGEIPDDQTNFWYYLKGKYGNIPQNNIDAYSEGTTHKFEPREDHKGNVARAIFYFYTMYDTEANQADPNYFESMRNTLCDWFYLDPVDSLEWERNWKIAEYQSDKPNPFILDCSLAGRTYCDYIDEACTAVGTQERLGVKNVDFNVFPNPASDKLNIYLNNTDFDRLEIELLDSYGKTLSTISIGSNQLKGQQFNWQIGDLSVFPGLYILSLTVISNNKRHRVNKKLVLID